MADSESHRANSPEFPPEVPDGRALLTIIKDNDLPRLRHYIASFPAEAILNRKIPYYEDPYYLAASEAKPETLQILLEVYIAALESPEPLIFEQQHGFSLLHAACRMANIDTVRFILDSQESQENQISLLLGKVNLHARDPKTERTPILEAVASLQQPHLDADKAVDDGVDWNQWVQNRIMKVEQLVEFLLDKGYSAKDTVPPFLNDVGSGRQPRDSVLGLAVSRAGTALVQKLINQGADVYLKHQHFHDTTTPLIRFGEGVERVLDVTTLHMASLFWNANVVKLLLEYDNYHKSKTSPDLVFSLDMNGRLPLHWAAAGPGLEECKLLDNELCVKITETFRLLLSLNPASINLPDDTGSTPLHYAVQAHAACGGSKHAKSAIQCLLEHGADPRMPDGRGQSVLHMLMPRSLQGWPIEATLLELLMAHGANVNQTDKNGNTALHIMVQNLRQTAMVKCLLDHGADIQLTNTMGETAFHAAARGYLPDQSRCNEAYRRATAENGIQAQDDMMRVLQAAAEENMNTMMSQRNIEGKTPRELLEETRSQWQEREQQIRGGVGRARGRGRGCGRGKLLRG